LLVTAAQQERTIRVPEDAKVLDAAGGELTQGLKTQQLREGARITILAERRGDRAVIRAIRMGGKTAAPAATSPGAQQDSLPPADAAHGPPALADDWEHFADGSMGRVTQFYGVGGIAIPAFIRKPSGPGPFPVVVMLHGGGYGKGATYGMGRATQSPTEDFIQAGWAVYAVDFRPTEKKLEPIEIEDTLEAVKAVRKMPFIDPVRVGLMGGSHGANVASRLLSRVDTKGAILCAPAALDLIEVKKAVGRGEPVVQVLSGMVAEMEKQHGAKAEEIEKDPANFGYASALTEVAQARCPILVINGRNDTSSPVSIIDLYVKKLRAAGKQVETYLPENGPHGFYFGHPDIPESKEAARRAVAFFQQRFGQRSGLAPGK
jgi:alpha-L-fucosidase 2